MVSTDELVINALHVMHSWGLCRLPSTFPRSMSRRSWKIFTGMRPWAWCCHGQCLARCSPECTPAWYEPEDLIHRIVTCIMVTCKAFCFLTIIHARHHLGNKDAYGLMD